MSAEQEPGDGLLRRRTGLPFEDEVLALLRIIAAELRALREAHVTGGEFDDRPDSFRPFVHRHCWTRGPDLGPDPKHLPHTRCCGCGAHHRRGFQA